LPASPNSIKVARVVETREGHDFFWNYPFPASNGYRWMQDRSDEVKKRNIRFLCPVRDSRTGYCCPAELYPKKSGKSYHYETRIGFYHHHVFSSKTRTVSMEVTQDVSSFLSTVLEPKKKAKADEVECITVYEDRFDVPQAEPEVVEPANILEYYIQTRGCRLSDKMPSSNYRFSDCLLNRDTINDFRSGRNQFAIPVLVIAEPVQDQTLSDSIRKSLGCDPETTAILCDPFELGSDEPETKRLYFIVRLENGSLPDKFRQGNRYLLLCRWELSRVHNIVLDGGVEEKVRVVEGAVEKSSVQIRVLDDKYYNVSEVWPSHEFS